MTSQLNSTECRFTMFCQKFTKEEVQVRLCVYLTFYPVEMPPEDAPVDGFVDMLNFWF